MGKPFCSSPIRLAEGSGVSRAVNDANGRTALGDNSLDCVVNCDDYALIDDFGWGEVAPGGEVFGDLNHDGTVDSLDDDLVTDNLGHTGDPTWKITLRFDNDPYGNFTTLDATWAAAYNYLDFQNHHQGLEFDPAIGWYQNRARIYSPTLMRFGQEEPSMGHPYVDGLNLYESYGDNPIDRSDADGCMSQDEINSIVYDGAPFVMRQDMSAASVPAFSNDFKNLNGYGAYAKFWQFSLRAPQSCPIHILQEIRMSEILYSPDAPKEIATYDKFYIEDWGIIPVGKINLGPDHIDTWYFPGTTNPDDPQNAGKSSDGMFVETGLVLAYKDSQALSDAIKRAPQGVRVHESANFGKVSDAVGGPGWFPNWGGPGDLTSFTDHRLDAFDQDLEGTEFTELKASWPSKGANPRVPVINITHQPDDVAKGMEEM